MRSLTAAVVVVTLVAAASSSAVALQPCRPPPKAILVYPTTLKDVARNTAVFVVTDGFTRLRLLGPGGQVVAVERRVPAVKNRYQRRLVRLRPKSPLAANTRYALQYLRIGQAPASAASAPRTFRTFRTGAAHANKAPALAVVLKRATLRWGKYQPRGYYRRGASKTWTSGGGRAAMLHAVAGVPTPAFIEVRFTMLDARGKNPVLHHFGYRFAKTRPMTSLGPCNFIGPFGMGLGPNNVRSGRYRLKLTPYSATGVAGKPLSLAGRVR